jgi:hypothetical protein
MVLIPFAIDPWARFGPLLQAFLTTTHHPPQKPWCTSVPPTATLDTIALMPTLCINELHNHHAHLVSSILRTYVGINWPHPPGEPSLVILALPRLQASTLYNFLALVSPKLLVPSSALPPVSSAFLPRPLHLTYIPSSLLKIHTL